jgi:hypothetical protein
MPGTGTHWAACSERRRSTLLEGYLRRVERLPRCIAPLLCVWLLASNLLAAFEFTRAAWDSNSALLTQVRGQLGGERVKVWADINWQQLKPQDALLIVHPTHTLSVENLNTFLRAGGRVALIDDFGAAGSLLENFQIHRVAAPTDPLEAFRNRAGLAIARREPSDASGSSLHPIVREVFQVVTNHATGLEPEPGVEWTPLLSIASRSRPPITLAAVGVIGDANACGLTEAAPVTAQCGRLFVMGDPSVFIDLMLHFDGNRKLLQSLTDYLLEDDAWGPRRGTLYIATNAIGERGGSAAREPLAQEIKRISRNISGYFRELSSQGFSSELCLLLAGLAALVTASVALRATAGRPSAVPRFVKAQSLLSQGGTAGRNALLSAPSTPPDLVALELKSGAEKYLAAVLGCPIHAGAQEALRQVAARPGHAVFSSRLRTLFNELARAETSVIQRNSSAFTENQLHTVARQLDDQLQSFTHLP